MGSVIEFHPPLGHAAAIKDPEVEGEYLVNIPGVIRILKEGETEKSRAVYATYVAEWHALAGQPLSAEGREEQAFRTAIARYGHTITSR